MNKSNIFARGLLGIPFSKYDDNYLQTRVVVPDKVALFFNDECSDSCFIEHPNLISSNYSKDGHVLIYHLPHLSADIENFLSGKYRKMSEVSKFAIMFCSEENKDQLWQIFYPSKDRIKALSKYLDYPLGDDAEVYDKPNVEEEVYESA